MTLDILTRIGQFVLYLGLGYFFLIVILAISGESVQAWPLRSRRAGVSKVERHAGPEAQAEHGEVAASHAKPVAGSRRISTEGHLEFLDRLRTNLKYQGSTIALIVFAVLVLGLQHVLDGPEIGTLLGGITGYVLGTSRGGSDGPAPPLGHGGADNSKGPDAAGDGGLPESPGLHDVPTPPEALASP